MARQINPRDRQTESTARLYSSLHLQPLSPNKRIALISIDAGRSLAPQVPAAYIGACASELAGAIWDLAQSRRVSLGQIDRERVEQYVRESIQAFPPASQQSLPVIHHQFADRVLNRPDVPLRLLESAARNVFRPRGIPVDVEHCALETVAVAGTSLTLHEHALREPVEAGKIILVPEPYFGAFATLTTRGGGSLGRQLVTLPTRDSGYRLVANVLEEAIRQHGRDRIGGLLFTNPNNPTFQVQDRAEMQGLADLIVRYNLPVVCDELYAELQRPGLPHVSLASLRSSDALGARPLYDLVLTTTGTSKLFNLDDDNLRSGVACSGNRAWVAKIQQAISRSSKTISKGMNLAGAAVYEHSTEAYREEGRVMIGMASDRFEREIAAANERLGWPAIQSLVTPQAAFYHCITLDPELCQSHGIRDSNDLFDYLYMCTGVVTMPLTMMGTDTVGVRLNVLGDTEKHDLDAQLEDVSRAVARFEDLARMMREGTAPSYAVVRRSMEEQRIPRRRELDPLSLLEAFGVRFIIR